MLKLKVLIKKENGEYEERNLLFDSGLSLRDILNSSNIRIQSGCVGNGSCGLCVVKVENGNVNEPSEIEKLQLSEEQINDGIRLACQIKPENDLQIKIENPLKKSKWKTIPEEREFCSRSHVTDLITDFPFAENVKNPIGVAIDLGTTFIGVSVFELKTGRLLTTRQGLNPQIEYGSDVLTRLQFAVKTPDAINKINDIVINAIKDVLYDISKYDGIVLKDIIKVVIAGNTAILTLLSKSNYKLLLNPDYWMKKIDCFNADTSKWADIWQINSNANINVVQPVAGFVGSDLIAGILSTKLIENESNSLLIDFGTNSELAFWDGKKIWVTSAAGGPAFEGCGITCGMPATEGAIYNADILENDKMNFSIISDIKPKGVCGSGIIDIIANLLKQKMISERGVFLQKNSENKYKLFENRTDIVLTKRDIDMIQQAKSAIAVGISVLLKKAKKDIKDLKKIYIGGSFGRFLKVENAQNIGLLPEITSDKIKLCNNTSLTGSEVILLSSSAYEKKIKIRSLIEMINLGKYENFDDMFLENLFLKPIAI